MAMHSSKKHKLVGAPAPLDTGAPVFALLPADEHWLENVKLVKARRCAGPLLPLRGASFAAARGL